MVKWKLSGSYLQGIDIHLFSLIWSWLLPWGARGLSARDGVPRIAHLRTGPHVLHMRVRFKVQCFLLSLLLGKMQPSASLCSCRFHRMGSGCSRRICFHSPSFHEQRVRASCFHLGCGGLVCLANGCSFCSLPSTVDLALPQAGCTLSRSGFGLKPPECPRAS